VSSAPATAKAMPTAAIRLPRRAVDGFVSMRMPTMKSVKATM
jgi:hypothetical protein